MEIVKVINLSFLYANHGVPMGIWLLRPQRGLRNLTLAACRPEAFSSLRSAAARFDSSNFIFFERGILRRKLFSKKLSP